MFDFLGSRSLEKEIALPFKVTLELQEDGYFLARCPELPGCAARGRTKSEALRHVSEAARLYLDSAAVAAFEVVWQDNAHPTLNALHGFFGRLVAGSNRDAALSSIHGDLGAWSLNPVSRWGWSESGAQPEVGPGEEDGQGLVDFTPQVYCLASYSGSGVPKLYAGSGANGAVFESVDGLTWELSYATGEARVHCLGLWKGRLYAGSSNSGKLFCYTGAHWSLVHRSPESAICALAEFHGELFFGSYPNGHIYASADGVEFHLAYESGQSFVRALCVYQDALYAATSGRSGGMLFRSADGVRWEKVFESKDPNFYCLHAFGGALWLGTGNQGRLYRSLDGGRWELAASLEEEGIRSMETFEGRLYLAGEGQGRLYRSRFALTPPPAIQDLRVDEVSSHGALLRWRTDRPADSRVLLSLDGQVVGETRVSQAVTEHRVALSYLRSLTQYSVQAISRCPDDSAPGFSQPFSFNTAPAALAEPRSPTHPDQEAWSKQPRALVSWSAPEGVERFHYCLDRVADSLPSPGGDGVQSLTERSAQLGPLEDGVWYLHLRSEDRAGNLGAQAAHYRLMIDTQARPPRLSSPTHPQDGHWSNRQRAQWSWEAPDELSGVAGYYLLLDQKPGSVPTPETGIWSAEARYAAELGADGDWYLHVVTVDGAGNIGHEAGHWRIRLDRRADPPALTSSSHPDQELWFNSANLRFEWEPPADASGVTGYYYVLDQRPETVPTAHTGTFTVATQAAFNGKHDGSWWFHVVTQDQAGNVGTQASHRMARIDTAAHPPELSSPTHPQGAWVSANRVVFEISPAEDLSGIVGYYYAFDRDRLTVPGPQRGTYTSERSIEFSGVADGLWTLHVVAKDAAGNVGVEAAHCAARVDTEARPPLLSSVSHPSQEDWSRLTVIDMAWDSPEDLSGIANYYYLLDREPDTVPTAHSGVRCAENKARVEAKEDGVWYFHVVSQDRAGNVGRVAAHHKIRIDSKALPPRLLCPTHPERGSWSSNPRPRFEWFEPEDSSGVVGYYWCMDRLADTVPTPATAAYTTERYALVDRGLEGDGIWWFHVVSRDRAGNVGVEAAHYPVHLDTHAAPPAIESATHPDRHAWSSNPNPVFSWQAPEDHSGIVGYYYLLNHSQTSVPSEGNGTWIEEPRVACSGLEDGVWTLHVVSKDRCGNLGTVAAHYSVRIDTKAEPPVVSSPTHVEGAWTRNSSPTFTWTPPQDLSGVAGYYYVLDRDASTVPTKESGQFSTGTVASFQRLEDGVWIFHVVAVDNAGNVGTRAAHYSVHVDSSAKAPRLSSSTHPDPDKWYPRATPLLQWTAPEDPSGVAGYFWCVDQNPDTVPGPQSTWTAEPLAALAALPDGEWWFHAATKDGAGNVSTEASHFRLRVDTQAPRPKLLCKTHPTPDDWYGQSRPVFVWDDGDDLSGIAGHYWVFDRNAATPLLPTAATWSTAATVTLPPQKDGIWYFHLAAKDNAGNLSEAAHLMLRIETEAPQTKLQPLLELTREASFQLQWRGEDKISGVASYELQVREGEDGAWSTWLAETTQEKAEFRGRDGVTFHFRARAKDKAGNVEAWDEKGPWPSVTVDQTPPEAVGELAAKPGVDGCVELAWNPAKDPVSGVASYEVWRSDTPGVLGRLVSSAGGVQGTKHVDLGKELQDGALYYYSVIPVDRAGNRAKEGHQQVSCLCDKVSLPPILFSPTHPSPLDWSNQPKARLTWEAPADATGIAGYYWTVDQSLSSVPTAKSGTWSESPEIDLPALKDGSWYVHVSSKDLAGNVSSEAGHYQLNIDSTPPPPPSARCLTHPHADAWSAKGEAEFAWSPPADPSGIAGYYWCVDAEPGTVPGPENGRWTEGLSAKTEELGEGAWYFHVSAKDRAGNIDREAAHLRLQIARSAPPPALSSPTHPKPGETGGKRVVLQWATPPYSEPIVAWHVALDRQKDTIPDQRHPKISELRVEYNDVSDGDWWFHIVSIDNSGKVGRLAAHYPMAVRSAGVLLGQVTKPNGILPLEGASVELFRAGKSVGKQVTGADGKYRFDAVEMGDLVAKLDCPGLPSLLLDQLRLQEGSLTVNLSAELCVLPSPAVAGQPLRFFVLAKEAGAVSVKVYTETGQVLGQVEATAARPGWVKLSWDQTPAVPGTVLFQATLTVSGGKVTKHPIRKVLVTK